MQDMQLPFCYNGEHNVTLECLIINLKSSSQIFSIFCQWTFVMREDEETGDTFTDATKKTLIKRN